MKSYYCERLVQLLTTGACMFAMLRRLFMRSPMSTTLEPEPDTAWSKDEAMKVLRRELGSFEKEGLVQLSHDLTCGIPPCLSDWDGCPLSYRLGHRGSTSEDSLGRGYNPFTRGWDDSKITGVEVLAAVEAELFIRELDEVPSEPQFVTCP